jgi:hypothetical protein
MEDRWSRQNLSVAIIKLTFIVSKITLSRLVVKEAYQGVPLIPSLKTLVVVGNIQQSFVQWLVQLNDLNGHSLRLHFGWHA